jgi:hypothetical protein
MNVNTSFPWPALCEEVRKLKTELREGQVLDVDFRGLARSRYAPWRAVPAS